LSEDPEVGLGVAPEFHGRSQTVGAINDPGKPDPGKGRQSPKGGPPAPRGAAHRDGRGHALRLGKERRCLVDDLNENGREDPRHGKSQQAAAKIAPRERGYGCAREEDTGQAVKQDIPGRGQRSQPAGPRRRGGSLSKRSGTRRKYGRNMAKPSKRKDRTVRTGGLQAATQAAVAATIRAVPGAEKAGAVRQAAKTIVPTRIRLWGASRAAGPRPLPQMSCQNVHIVLTPVPPSLSHRGPPDGPP
jgi:hypothetical protein